jgi:hypothetical protein
MGPLHCNASYGVVSVCRHERTCNASLAWATLSLSLCVQDLTGLVFKFLSLSGDGRTATLQVCRETSQARCRERAALSGRPALLICAVWATVLASLKASAFRALQDLL